MLKINYATFLQKRHLFDKKNSHLFDKKNSHLFDKKNGHLFDKKWRHPFTPTQVLSEAKSYLKTF